MKKAAAIAQIALIVAIVAFGTWHLFKGNFVEAYSTIPFLFVYWVWVVARKRKAQIEERGEEEEER